MSNLYVDSITEKTSGNGVHIPGHIVGVWQDKTDTPMYFDHGSLTYSDFGLSILVTPTTINSKFLMRCHIYTPLSANDYNPNGGAAFSYQVGGTRYYPHDASTHTNSWTYNSHAMLEEDDGMDGANISNIDYVSKVISGEVLFSPNTTSQINFNLGYHGSDKFRVNQGGSGLNGANYNRGWTTLTVMEIAQ
jgi:hypothetical protein